MPGPDVRHVHIFDRPDPLDVLRATTPSGPSRVDRIDEGSWALRLSGDRQPRPLETSAECNEALNRAVERVWTLLRDLIQQFDRKEVLKRSLEVTERVADQRDHFRRISRALRALYGDEATEVGAKEEAERGLASHAAQVLVEIGVCEAGTRANTTLERTDFDYLLAGSGMLTKLGGFSDAAHRGIVETGEICGNGSVRVDRTPLDALTRSFALSTQEHVFEETDHEYETYFSVTPDRRPGAGWLDEPEATEAFQAEFGATPAQLGKFVAGLIDRAIDAEQTVIETTAEDLFQGALGSGLDEPSASHLLSRLSLRPRKRWDEAPEGFSDRDWYPWRYGRRLSLLSRPLVFVDDAGTAVLYSVGSLKNTFGYLADGIESGVLNADYFHCAEMRRLVGGRIDALGRSFCERVAESIRELGWTAHTEVPMTQLGAPAELGDVDVLAWCAEREDVLVVECKRLRPSFGVTGIVDRLVEFQGDAKDRLDRHVRRLEWIDANEDCWPRIGLHTPNPRPVGYFVTNRPVPFQFADGLPFPPERILTERQFLASPGIGLGSP